MKGVIFFMFVTHALVSYNFKNLFGQVMLDSSGNKHHSVRGKSLLIENSDGLLTNHGIFFQSNSRITMPPNCVSQVVIEDFLENYFITLSIFLSSPGIIFSLLKEYHKIIVFYESGQIFFRFNTSEIHEVMEESNFYLDSWNQIGFEIMKIDEFNKKVCIKLNKKSSCFDLPILSPNNEKIEQVFLGSDLLNDNGFMGIVSHLKISSFGTTLYENLHEFIFPSFSEVTLSNCHISCVPSICFSPLKEECISIEDLCFPSPYSSLLGTCLFSSTNFSLTQDSRRKLPNANTGCLIIGSSQCTQCITGYYLNNGACINCSNGCIKCDSHACFNCTTGFYLLNKICNPCDTGCQNCTAESCLLCIEGYYLSSQGTCSLCNNSCQTCNGPLSTNCLKCNASNSNLVSSTSGSTCACNTGFYPNYTNSFVCEECDPTCFSCTQSLSCTVCVSNQMTFSSTGSCSCRSGTYFFNKTCLACSNGCETCQSQLCSSCSQGYYFNNYSCVMCDPSCESCNGSFSNNCTKCQSNALMYKGFCICNKGFFMGDNGYCQSCIENCEICTNDSYCQLCSGAYFYNTSANLCINCDLDCFHCVGPGKNECLSCKNSTIIVNQPYGACSCTSGQYMTSSNPLICVNCPENCQKCNNKECFQCEIGFSLHNNSCYLNTFTLRIAVSNDNSIFLYFSEQPLKNLLASEISIFYQSNSYNFNLTMTSNTSYLVNVNDLAVSTMSRVLNLNFNLEIFSVSYASLQTLNYTCNLNYLSGFTAVVASNLATVSQSSMAAAGSSGIASVLSGNPLSVLWISLNSAQIICYLPLQNIEYPPLLYNFLLSVQPISQIPQILTIFFNYSCQTSQIPIVFQNYGYNCKYFLVNTQQIILVFIVAVIIFPFYFIASFIIKGKKRKYFEKKIRAYRWNMFLRYLIESYIDLMIPSYIALNTVKFT